VKDGQAHVSGKPINGWESATHSFSRKKLLKSPTYGSASKQMNRKLNR